MSAMHREPIEAVLHQLSLQFKSLTGRIQKIKLVNEFPGTASIGPSDPTKVSIDGYTLVLSKRALDFRHDASVFLTWKEAQFLTGVPPEYLPKVTLNIPEMPFPALYYIVLHELGHVAWYEHGPDKVICTYPVMGSAPYWQAAFFLEQYLAKHPSQSYKSLACEYTDDSFLSQSWLRQWKFDDKNRFIVSRLPSYDVSELAKICFYGRDTPKEWTPEEIRHLYSKLYSNTPFTTVYAAYFKPEEDFAESFAFFHLSRMKGADYTIELIWGQKFDMLKKINAEIFRGKREVLDRIYDSIQWNSTRD